LGRRPAIVRTGILPLGGSPGPIALERFNK
jgi:hypothetical protein